MLLDIIAGAGIRGQVKDDNESVILPAVVADCLDAYTVRMPKTGIKKLQALLAPASTLSEEEKDVVKSSPSVALALSLAAKKHSVDAETASRNWDILQPLLQAAEESGLDGGVAARASFIAADLLYRIDPEDAFTHKVEAYEQWARAFPRKPAKLALGPGQSMLSTCGPSHPDEWHLKHDLFNDIEYEWSYVGGTAADDIAPVSRFVATTVTDALVHSMQEDELGTMFVFHNCNILLTSNVAETVPPPQQDRLDAMRSMQVITLAKATILGQRGMDVEAFQQFQLPALLALRESGEWMKFAPFLLPDVGLSAVLTAHGLTGDMFATFRQHVQYHIRSLTIIDMSEASRLAALPAHLAFAPAEHLQAAKKIMTARHGSVAAASPVALFLGEMMTGTATVKKEANFVQRVATALKVHKKNAQTGQVLGDSCINSFTFVTELPPGVTTATILVGPEQDVTFVAMELSGVEHLISFPCLRKDGDKSSSEVLAAKLGIGSSEVPALRHACGSMFSAEETAAAKLAEKLYSAMATHCQ